MEETGQDKLSFSTAASTAKAWRCNVFPVFWFLSVIGVDVVLNFWYDFDVKHFGSIRNDRKQFKASHVDWLTNSGVGCGIQR